MTNIKSRKVAFIVKAMLGERERFCILIQQISGNRACIYASDFAKKCSNIRKTLSCSEDTKKLNLGGGGGLGREKRRLSYYIFLKQLFHSPCLLHCSTLR